MVWYATLLSAVVLLLPALAEGDCSGSAPGPCVRVELWADDSYTQCSLAAPSGEVSVFYITASFDGADGIAGVELRVAGLPSEWVATSTPNPASNVSLGDPLGAGANIAFPAAQFGAHVQLYEVAIVPLGAETSAQLLVVPHSVPSNPNFDCSVVLPACGPCFTAYCAEPGFMSVNSSCLVAVQERTFGSVKRLYK